MPDDIISLNRQFLHMARSIARGQLSQKAREMVCGLPKSSLEAIGKLDLEQIDVLASSSVSLLSIRLSGDEIERMVSLEAEKSPAYIVSLVASKGA